MDIYDVQSDSILAFKSNNAYSSLIDFSLTPDSVVVDLGAYQGDYVKKIWHKYKCNIHAFEPVDKYAKFLRESYQNVDKIHIHQYGAGNSDREAYIQESAQGSSIHLTTNETGDIIQIVDISKYLTNLGIDKIDLMKINIEGDEFDVIDNLYTSGLIKRIGDIVVQCHPFVKNAESRYSDLNQQLSETHACMFYYPWIWENWKLNGTY